MKYKFKTFFNAITECRKINKKNKIIRTKYYVDSQLIGYILLTSHIIFLKEKL